MLGTVDYELLLVVLHNDVSRRSTSRLQRKEGQTVLGVDAQTKNGSTSEKAGRCARRITKALYGRNLFKLCHLLRQPLQEPRNSK